MFRGSIPGELRSIIHETVKGWNTDEVYVGCSGNFTVERTLEDLNVRLHGNDITIYSCLLGSWMAGDMMRMDLKPEAEDFEWLLPFMETPNDKLATLFLCTRMTEGIKSKSLYSKRMMAAYKENWAKLHEKTKKRVDDFAMRIESFAPADCFTWIDSIPRDACFTSYPPFEAKDYPNMYKKSMPLEDLFDWDEPEYGLLDEERFLDYLRKMTEFRQWMFGVNRRLPEFDKHLKGVAKTTNRGIPVFIYGSEAKSRVVVPRQVTEPLLIPHLAPEQELGGKLSIHPIKHSQFAHLRSMYMNRGIRPGTADMAVAVTVDGVLIGVYAFMMPSSLVAFPDWVERPHVYLLSDFPVANSRYKRLSKLVLTAALSVESKILAEQMVKRRVKSLVTTAFSQNPVSMKYRGMFDLVSRKEQPEEKTQGGGHDGQKYMLNYAAKLGQWTLEEGFDMWRKKHGKH